MLMWIRVVIVQRWLSWLSSDWAMRILEVSCDDKSSLLMLMGTIVHDRMMITMMMMAMRQSEVKSREV